MRAILINPTERTVTAVEYNGDLKQAYSLMSCELVDVVYIGKEQDGIFVDDEGLFSKGDEQRYFVFYRDDGRESFLAGNGLVVGCDDEGNTIEPSVSLEYIESHVQWCEPLAGAKYAEYILSKPPVVTFG
jgi:hypothetical protein